MAVYVIYSFSPDLIHRFDNVKVLDLLENETLILLFETEGECQEVYLRNVMSCVVN
jgi:hypothetical protein